MSASVLIVEKNRFVRHLLREVLEEAGYRVSAVATTSFARLLVTSYGEQFDLILLHDRPCSGQSGDFCSSLNADGFDGPIVFLSEAIAELQDASRSTTGSVIRTPFTIAALLRQVEISLQHIRSTTTTVLHRPRFHSASRR